MAAGQRCVGRAGRRAGRAWAGDAGGQARGGAAAHAVGDVMLVERERPERGLRRHELHLDTAAWAGLLRLA